jgi:hypothetical protein
MNVQNDGTTSNAARRSAPIREPRVRRELLRGMPPTS